MKKLLPLLLAVLTALCLGGGALALDVEDPYLSSAEALHELGLFQGTGTNADGTPIYDLDKTPSRNQALIMLVRLLGKEAEAKNGAWDIPFTDVSAEMKPYVGYAYANGLTTGYTAESFRGGQKVSGNQYVSFLLRALGYESSKDFEVAKATELSDQIDLTAGQSLAGFTRGDVAQLSAAALSTPLKNSETTMMRKLQTEGVIPAEAETPERPAYLLPDVVAPEGLEFHEIPRNCWSLWGYIPDYFQADHFEYAIGDDGYYYFRVYFTSSSVKEFYVLYTNRLMRYGESGTPYLYESSDLYRYAADAKSGVFTWRVEKSLAETYYCVQIGPSEDRQHAPDYLLDVGYFLTEDGSEPEFQEIDCYQDNSSDTTVELQSVEYADVTGGRLYQVNFQDDTVRTVVVTLWSLERDNILIHRGGIILQNTDWTGMHSVVGENTILYFVPNCVQNTDLEVIQVSFRENDYDGRNAPRSAVWVFLDGSSHPEWDPPLTHN